VCCFDPASPHLTAFDIREWIHSQLQVSEHSVTVIQIDGICRQVYIKFIDLSFAGMGLKRLRLANVPPKVSHSNIRAAMSQFGNIQDIQEETWAKHYRYKVLNGVKIVTMTLSKHILSYVVIDGHRALTSYDSQPQTCYGCRLTDHMYHACPKRRVAKATPTATANPTWADITAAMVPPSSGPGVSDNNSMVSDSYPQSSRTMSPIPADYTLERMDTTLSEGRPAGRDEPRIDKSTRMAQVHCAPTSLKWADEIPDLDMEQSVVGHPAADTDVEQLSATDLRPHIPPSDGGNDKTTTSIENLAARSDTPVMQEVNGSEIIRKKTMRLEKGGEGAHERRRSRTRHATLAKDKH